MNNCKGPGCENEAKRDYCSPACRARAWRERHILRCKHGEPIEIKMEVAGQAVTLQPRQSPDFYPCEECIASVGQRLPHKDCARVLAQLLLNPSQEPRQPRSERMEAQEED